MLIQFIGYELRIIYDDYNIYEAVIKDLNEIDDICLTLVNNDNYFCIEYCKKYKLDDGSFVYSKKEEYQIDNKNIPQRELYIQKFNDISQVIAISNDIKDKILNKDNIKVSELTLVASFRYALGRRTYIVSEVVENILKNWNNLSQNMKIKMKEEIKEVIENNTFGDQIDLENWKQIVEK